MTKYLHNIWLRWFLIGLFVLWFFFAVASYFVVYKPFSPLLLVQLAEFTWLPLGSDWSALGRATLDLLVAVWLGLMGLGCGLWMWDFLTQRRKGAKEEKGRDLERVLFGFGLGFGVVGLVVLLVGVMGWLNTAVLTTIAIILSVIGLPKLVRLRVGWKRPSRPIAIYLIIVLLLAITLAVLPPTSWDGLFYHLKGPKLYLEAGRIYGGVDIPHFNFPSLFQMWFLLAMGIRGDVAAQLIHILFLFGLGGMVYAFAREQFGLQDGWTAVLFLFATPMVPMLATWSYNDLGLAFFSAGSVYAFLKWQQNDGKKNLGRRLTRINADKNIQSASSALVRVQDFNHHWLVVSGVFAGLAMSMKYTSVVGPGMLGLLLLWQLRHDWRQAMKLGAVFGGTAVLTLAPWLIKNWAFTGNPVYPFLFDGLYWDAFRAAGYGNSGSGIGFDIIALLRLPYDMTLGIRDASQDGRTGAFFLAFLPLILTYAFWKKGKTTDFTDEEKKKSAFIYVHPRPISSYSTILLISLGYYLFWMMGVIGSKGLWQTRLLLPMFTILCPVLAWVFEAIREFDHPQFSLRRFLNMGVGFVLVLIVFNLVWQWVPAQPWAYLSGAETRDAHLTRRLGAHYAAMQEINAQLPPDAIVKFLWEPRSYYCDVDCRPDSILDAFDHLVYLHKDADSIAAALRAEGVTHILIWQTGLDFIVESPESASVVDTAVLTNLQTNHLEPTFSVAEGGYQVFALR
ncbi:MAG: hypothetical protein GY943_15385 [Chloroflexi bacterium]|nr:hypothetical protein [Chloroflexota bacterium]